MSSDGYDTKDYRVTIKIRNNLILRAIELSGGQMGQKWCEENGLCYSVICSFVAMKKSPLNANGGLVKQAQKLCDVLNKHPQDLWNNQQLYPLEKNFTEVEMSYSQILAISNNGENSYIEGFDDFSRAQTKKLVDKTLDTLTSRERQVIKLRFYDDMTLDDVGKVLDVTRERVRQIETKAMRKLRHPARAGVVVDCVDFKEIDKEQAKEYKAAAKKNGFA